MCICQTLMFTYAPLLQGLATSEGCSSMSRCCCDWGCLVAYCRLVIQELTATSPKERNLSATEHSLSKLLLAEWSDDGSYLRQVRTRGVLEFPNRSGGQNNNPPGTVHGHTMLMRRTRTRMVITMVMLMKLIVMIVMMLHGRGNGRTRASAIIVIHYCGQLTTEMLKLPGKCIQTVCHPCTLPTNINNEEHPITAISWMHVCFR